MKLTLNGVSCGQVGHREAAVGIVNTLRSGGEVRMTAPGPAELEPFEQSLRELVSTLDMPVAVQRQGLTLVLRRKGGD